MKRALTGLFALSLLGGAVGCGSYSTLDRARTLDPGRVRLMPAIGAIGGAESGGAGFAPRFEVALGYGARENVEVFGKVWYGGFVGGTKVQAIRSESAMDVELSFAPALGWHWSDKLSFDLPILGGLNIGRNDQLVFAIRPSYIAWVDALGPGQPASFFQLGGTIGYWFQPADFVALLPEVALVGNLYATEGFSSPTGDGVGMQFLLGAAALP